jgi:NAD(P)-dependent dehydrogenase (short-subunit alcohol dehydrogenase family)
MRVTIVDNNQATLDLAAQTLKGEVTCVKADVSDISTWRALKEKVGEVDFLMLNAGRMVRGSWGDGEYFKEVCGAVRCCGFYLKGGCGDVGMWRFTDRGGVVGFGYESVRRG